MTTQNKRLKPVSLELKRKIDAAPVEAVKVAELEFDTEQPRTRIEQERIESLGASIKANGQLQNIIVRNLDGKKIIVCGERRVRACQHIKQKTINAKIVVLSDAEVNELQIIENAQREDLNPIDEAVAYQKYEAKGMPLAEISHRVGKPVEFVRGRLMLNKLIPALQEAVIKEELSLEVAKEIAPLGADTQQALIEYIFEDVPVKLLQKTVEDEPEEEEYDDNAMYYAEDDEDFEGDPDASADYANGETPFDDETAEAAAAAEQVEIVAETEEPAAAESEPPPAQTQVLFQRKSISLGKVRSLIAEKVLCNLSNAPFDLTDTRLHPEGRVCEGCPNRNGSNTLFDLGSDDNNICLDNICFYNKGRELVRITREAYAPAEGEIREAKTITRNYYTNSPYRQPDTLIQQNYRRIAVLGEEVPEENNCEHSEYAVCVDAGELARVYLICTNSDCEKHYPKYDFSSSSTSAPKPELTAEERSLNYQNSRQKGVTGNACERARPEFFSQAAENYDALRWIFNNEDLRFEMIKRFCQLVIAENSGDFVFACEAVGIKALRSIWNTTAEEIASAELLTSYAQSDKRTFDGDLRKIDDDRLSKLLFLLTFVHNGRDFRNSPIEADAQMQSVATVLGEDYETFFAAKQVEVAPDKQKPYAEKYLADLKAGIAEERPNLFTETANAKKGVSGKASQKLPETVNPPTAENPPEAVKAVEAVEADSRDEETQSGTGTESEAAENTVFAKAE